MPDEFQAATRLPDISFLTRGANPPTVYYVAPDDNIVIRFWSQVANIPCFVRIRLLLASGQLVLNEWQVVTDGTRTMQQIVKPLAEGCVLSCVVEVYDDSVRRGQIYATVGICKGILSVTTPFTIFLAAYATRRAMPAWPPGGVEDSLEGRGNLRSITGTNPAAGAEISETVPTGALWRLIALYAPLVTDATVANRSPILLIDDGALPVWRADARLAQTATQTIYWMAGDGLAGLQRAVDTEMWSLPTHMLLGAGYRVRTSTYNLQAGDNWGAPQMLVEEWLAP